jgi:NAD+ kinase
MDVRISDRSLPDAASSLLALNEVVIEKIDFGHTVRLATTVDGEEALTYSADGLIIATPTGSTAYNLSAGGPILAPTLRAMVVTPVAPHFSLDRSLVLTDAQEVSVEVAPDRAGVLVIDGQEVGRLQPGATIRCAVSTQPVRVVRNEPQAFGGILRFRLLADRAP